MREQLATQKPQKGNAVSAEINIYNPEELGPPMGQYTHVTRVKASEFLFIAGMLSGDAAGNIIGEGEFEVQTAQVFRNIEAALKSAGASWANVVQFTTYLVHSQDIPKFMAFRLREFPKMFPDGKYPPNTLLMVDRLVKEVSWSKYRRSPQSDRCGPPRLVLSFRERGFFCPCLGELYK